MVTSICRARALIGERENYTWLAKTKAKKKAGLTTSIAGSVIVIGTSSKLKTAQGMKEQRGGGRDREAQNKK